MSDMIGMNVAEIERLGHELRDVYAADIKRFSAQIERLVNGAGGFWLGQDYERFRSWWPDKRRRLLAIAADIEGFGTSALNNAGDQTRASNTGAVGGQLGNLEQSRSMTAFQAPSSGRGVVVEALYGTTDGRRAEYDEIEIRKLDNGRYVVVLPGVTDLSAAGDNVRRDVAIGDAVAGPSGGIVGAGIGVAHGVNDWYDGPSRNTVRRMEYAIGEAERSDFVNPYSERVIEQMKRAGIPAGADVMLVGHSFGAYTAMDLAGNDKFNSADGDSEGYSVNITHVVAAGADTNWRFGDLPPATHALVLNNKHDAVFVAEDPLHADVAPTNANQLQIEFNNNPLAGLKGAGHHPDNYATWLQESNRPELNSWLESVGPLYGSAGTAYSVKVPDYE